MFLVSLSGFIYNIWIFLNFSARNYFFPWIFLDMFIHTQCWEEFADIDYIKKCIKNGHSVLIIMRGVPGIGKTHLAKFVFTIKFFVIFVP